MYRQWLDWEFNPFIIIHRSTRTLKNLILSDLIRPKNNRIRLPICPSHSNLARGKSCLYYIIYGKTPKIFVPNVSSIIIIWRIREPTLF